MTKECIRSDLIRLGSAKVWECTETLAEYLTRLNEANTLVSQFQDARVLDLGCGAGILGILALQNGASNVQFQDYVNLISLQDKFSHINSTFHL